MSLIICSYQRPKSLLRLLRSLKVQDVLPDDIIVVDASEEPGLEKLIEEEPLPNVRYFQVAAADRGLTKQRNFGVQKVCASTEIVCFLDDDVVPQPSYFRELLKAYQQSPEVMGVGGFIEGEVAWRRLSVGERCRYEEFEKDGWARLLGKRFLLRKMLRLEPDLLPGWMPAYGHGYSIAFLPPSGNMYEVEMLIGAAMSFRTTIFKKLQFSHKFQGYALYEDADFSLRASVHGRLLVNTQARLMHYHAPEGRPNSYTYGKMVVKNGWYVWRIKYPAPSIGASYKWLVISFLLSLIRFANCLNPSYRKAALQESVGRFYSIGSLVFKKPDVLIANDDTFL